MLQHAGFEVEDADTGMSGIEIAKAIRPAVILLDIKLPDISGFEVCHFLKADPVTAPIPVIHITANAFETENKIQSIEEGADAYLTLPIDHTYLVAIVRSFVRLRNAEKARVEYLQDLKTKNDELTHTLETLRDERAMKEKFVATLSHDLRNPLAAIKLAADVAKVKLKGHSDNLPQLEQISQTVTRADQMIQDLLDSNLIQAGQKLPLRANEADLRQIARATADELSGRFGRPFVLDCPEPLQGKNWDPQAIRRVIENLLQNAVKYGAEDRDITLSLRKLGDRIRLSVHNWGAPIDEKLQKELFTAYRRGDSQKNKDKGGWGLGLTLVQAVVEAHSGTIRVESSEEKGTRFVVELPYILVGDTSLPLEKIF